MESGSEPGAGQTAGQTGGHAGDPRERRSGTDGRCQDAGGAEGASLGAHSRLCAPWECILVGGSADGAWGHFWKGWDRPGTWWRP